MTLHHAAVTAILVALGAASAKAEDAGQIPSWCCPTNCLKAEGPLSIREDGVTMDRQDGSVTFRYSRNLYLGEAPDNQARICIGFTDFGDKEVKCLLMPPMT